MRNSSLYPTVSPWLAHDWDGENDAWFERERPQMVFRPDPELVEVRFGGHRRPAIDLGHVTGRFVGGFVVFAGAALEQNHYWREQPPARILAVRRGLADGQPCWVPAYGPPNGIHPYDPNYDYPAKELHPEIARHRDLPSGRWRILTIKGGGAVAFLPQHTAGQLQRAIHQAIYEDLVADPDIADPDDVAPYPGWWDEAHGYRLAGTGALFVGFAQSPWAFGDPRWVDPEWDDSGAAPAGDIFTVGPFAYHWDLGTTGYWTGRVLWVGLDLDLDPAEPHPVLYPKGLPVRTKRADGD